MSSQSIELAGRFYESWNGGDPANDCLELLTEDFKYVNPTFAVEGGTRHGHEGWREVIASLAAGFESYTHDPDEMQQLPNGQVLCTVTFRARGRSGISIEKLEPQLLTFSGEKVSRLQWFNDRSEALAQTS